MMAREGAAPKSSVRKFTYAFQPWRFVDFKWTVLSWNRPGALSMKYVDYSMGGSAGITHQPNVLFRRIPQMFHIAQRGCLRAECERLPRRFRKEGAQRFADLVHGSAAEAGADEFDVEAAQNGSRK